MRRQSGSSEGAALLIDWHGIVGIVGIATDITGDTKLAPRFCEGCEGDKRWDGLCEIDAIDEDIRGCDLRKRSPRCSLSHVPFQYVGSRNPDNLTEIDGSGTAAAQCTHDKDARMLVVSPMESEGEGVFDSGYQIVVGRIAGDGTEGSGGVNELMGPGQERNGCASVSRIIPESGDTPTGGVGQEFDVIEGAAAAFKPGEIAIPVILMLVAVPELDVGMVKRD